MLPDYLNHMVQRHRRLADRAAKRHQLKNEERHLAAMHRYQAFLDSLPRDNQCTVATAPEEWQKSRHVRYWSPISDFWLSCFFGSTLKVWQDYDTWEELPPDTILTLVPPPREVPS